MLTAFSNFLNFSQFCAGITFHQLPNGRKLFHVFLTPERAYFQLHTLSFGQFDGKRTLRSVPITCQRTFFQLYPDGLRIVPVFGNVNAVRIIGSEFFFGEKTEHTRRKIFGMRNFTLCIGKYGYSGSHRIGQINDSGLIVGVYFFGIILVALIQAFV